MLCISSLVVAAMAGAPQKLQGGASQALFPVLSVPLLSGLGEGGVRSPHPAFPASRCPPSRTSSLT